MLPNASLCRCFLYLLSFCLSLPPCVALAQQTSQSPPANQEDEVVRVNTELVQTDVMVVDRQGQFVDHLTRDQFELRVDGKPQEISFFEHVTAGSYNEEAQLAAARGLGGREAAVRPLDRGRTLVFFIDDLHLAPDSLARIRKLLSRFIDEQIGQNDQALITSTTGQIGFLQQLTDDKVVMRAAVARLSNRQRTARDNDRPVMTETQAIAIEQNDLDVVSYFIDETAKENPAYFNDRRGAELEVRRRAQQLIELSSSIAVQTLSGLQNLMRASAEIPGRKLVYFISDGFVLESRRSDVTERLRRVADAALRAGVVIYTLDARGLSAEITGISDASSGASPDPSGRLARAGFNDLSATQEPLRALAGDTGGRALLNTNALENAVAKALKETSVYYLIAWRPEQAGERKEKFRRIEVRIKGHPELSTMTQRGYFNTTSEPTPKQKSKRHETTKSAETKVASDAAEAARKELFAALRSPFPKSALPVSLTANYFDVPNAGTILTASIQIELPPSNIEGSGEKHDNQAELIGAVYDAQGKLIDSFQRLLALAPSAADASATAASRRIVFSQQLPMPPGLYQVRVASREPRTGRTGSAAQWIEIPDLTPGHFSLSSVFIGERAREDAVGGKDASATQQQQIVINADRRFARTSWLRFLCYIYNAARNSAAASPDVALQIQVFRDDQPVITTPLRKVAAQGFHDLARLPYAAEIALNDLPAGLYVLQVTAIDRTAKSSASQRVKFTIE